MAAVSASRIQLGRLAVPWSIVLGTAVAATVGEMTAMVLSSRSGVDLQVYRGGIQALLAGRDPYLGIYTTHRLDFTYPPASMLFLWPLVAAPVAVVQTALEAFSVVGMAVSVYAVARGVARTTVRGGAGADVHANHRGDPGADVHANHRGDPGADRGADWGSNRGASWDSNRGAGRGAGGAGITGIAGLAGLAGSRRAYAVAAVSWACLAAAAVEPARSGIFYGQVDPLLMTLVVVDLLVVGRRHRGWLLGVAAAVKLTPLVFVLVLVLERQWKALARVVGVFVGSSVLFVCLWPSTARHYLFHSAWKIDRIGSLTFQGNLCWDAVAHRLPFPAPVRSAIWLALSLLTLAVVVPLARRCLRRGAQVHAVFAVALLGLLVSPISWTHEWIWVVLIPALLLGSRRQPLPRSVGPMLWAVLALAMAAPYWWIASGAAGDVLQDLLPILAGLTLLVWWARERSATFAALVPSRSIRLRAPALPLRDG